MVKPRRLVRTSRQSRREHTRELVQRQRGRDALGRQAARRLAGRLNASADYATYCAAELAALALPLDVEPNTTREMQRPANAWRTSYANVTLIEALLVESLDLLARGQLTTDAMRRFNENQQREQTLVPMLGQAWGGGLALSVAERVIPDAPATARLMPRDGGEPIAEFFDVVAAGMLNRLKRCPQCQQWFVDESRNRTGTRCSTECTNRWWSRERRHAAAHHGSTRRKRR